MRVKDAVSPGAGAVQTPASVRMRDLVEASRRRSASHIGSPDAARPGVAAAERDLRNLRRSHPLAPVFDVLQRLLIAPAREAGLLVAVTDARGRLVWVEGHAATLREAEHMAFVPGADWSERAIGTSAPGSSVATGREFQVVRAEHFAPAVQAWSCSAVPIRDPGSDRILGAVDVTGDDGAVAPHALPLLRAAVAAVEAELRYVRLAEARSTASATPAPTAPVKSASSSASPVPGRGSGRHADPLAEARPSRTNDELRLQLLGRDRGLLSAPGTPSIELSRRHSELLLLLADHPRGLTGPELSALIWPDGGNAVTLRAELARLRAVLAGLDPSIRLLSQPYRLDRMLVTDAADVLRAIDQGAHRRALRAYAGAPLPGSESPGVEAFRDRTGSTVREAVLAHGSVETVLAYLELPEAEHDAEANLLALQLLPPRSPKRAAIVARAASLES